MPIPPLHSSNADIIKLGDSVTEKALLLKKKIPLA